MTNLTAIKKQVKQKLEEEYKKYSEEQIVMFSFIYLVNIVDKLLVH